MLQAQRISFIAFHCALTNRFLSPWCFRVLAAEHGAGWQRPSEEGHRRAVQAVRQRAYACCGGILVKKKTSVLHCLLVYFIVF